MNPVYSSTTPIQPFNNPKSRSFGEIILCVLRAIRNLSCLFCISPKKINEYELKVFADSDTSYFRGSSDDQSSSLTSTQLVAQQALPQSTGLSPKIVEPALEKANPPTFIPSPIPYQADAVKHAIDDEELIRTLAQEDDSSPYSLMPFGQRNPSSTQPKPFTAIKTATTMFAYKQEAQFQLRSLEMQLRRLEKGTLLYQRFETAFESAKSELKEAEEQLTRLAKT